MASVRIENDAWDDPRYVLLGQRLGIDRFDALIRCARVWSYCTDRGAHVLPAEMIDAHVGVAGFAEHMVGVQLAEKVAQGIRVCGTRGRIEWLDKRKKASRKGGVTTRAKWRPSEGQTRAKRGPSAPTLLCSGSAPTLDPEKAIVARAEQPALLVMPDERQRARDAVGRVIAKLNERTSVQYQASGKSTSALVLGLLKSGYTEADLRLVIWHRAELWLGDAKMSQCLRPSTLFRRSNFEQYLPEAVAAAIKRKGALPDGLSGKGSRPTQQAPPRDDPKPADVRAQGSFLDGLKGGGGT